MILFYPVPSPLPATTFNSQYRSVPLVNDKSFLGNEINPVPLLSEPLVPGSPLVDNCNR